MTPLAAIRGYVETLGMTDLPLDAATRQRYLGIVNEEAERLERIIGDLLDLARLEGGGGSFRNRKRVAGSSSDARARTAMRPPSPSGITLDTTLEPGLDDRRGDRNRLEQALQNLVANAIRHTPDGGRVRSRPFARRRRW